ncbi:MAG: SDR family oxidoreductase [Ktedonobacteraceae bacterium]|nr:SDR family oxidoreductase [Ktedonobacteraceae bacterium]MBO0796245.1 SDR family oxidoreductase [Ktedonobacteraceae bacterium]
MYTYTGKTAMITGASTGIGEAFARELAKRGMHVILVARSEEALRKLAVELTAQYGVRSEVIVADLSQEKVSAQVKAAVEAKGLHVDLLVNNAGIGTYDAFEKLDPERDHQQVMLNVVAVVDLAHAFLPEMVERGEGALINVSSMAAYMPMPYMAVYAASKAFVLSLSEALWAEYHQRGIRVTALCPGQVKTAFHQKTEHAVPSAGAIISAEEAVLAALHALEQGKSSIIPNWMNQASILSARFMSRSFLVQSTASRLKPQN